MIQSFHQQFEEFLKKRFPLWETPEFAQAQLAPNLISSFVLKLPQSLRTQVEHFVATADEVTHLPAFATAIADSEFRHFDPGNRAILTSFDFHVTPEMKPKLIEINTNASFALIGTALSDFQKVPSANFTEQLHHAILNELKLNGQTQPPSIAIVDENPSEQKMFIEFVFYQQLFASWGWKASIYDGAQLRYENGSLIDPNGIKINFIYNRDTDFFLAHPRNLAIRQAYLARAVCVSPHPREYALMADKTRLIDLSRAAWIRSLIPAWTESVAAVVPETLDLAQFPDREEIWAQRKNFMFKPKTAFGAKAVYRGSSISKKTFLKVVTDDFIAQEFVPAPEIQVRDANGDEATFKYDLRFYAYQSQVQFAMARLYRGQVTNFQEAGGGFTAIQWE